MTVLTALNKLYNAAMDAEAGQVAYGELPLGQLQAAASWTTGSTTITMAQAVPSWVVAGMNVFDVTNSAANGQIGTVSGSTGTTLTLSADAAKVSTGANDVLQFGFTPSDLSVGYAAGADIRGIVQLCVLKAQEIDALMSYLENDVITSSQDNAANTLLASVVTALS